MVQIYKVFTKYQSFYEVFTKYYVEIMKVIDNQIDINFKKLIFLLEKLDLEFPIAELSRKTGYSESTISPYLKGKVKPSAKFLQSILNNFNVNLDDFTEKNEVETDLILKQSKDLGVPYYDIDFTASFLTIENNSQLKPNSYINHPFFAGCDYVVRASGQSMAKVISHGDAIGLIKVDNWREFFPFGEIYAIVTKDDQRMIKVITKGETDDTYTLISKPTESKKDEFPTQQIKRSSILSIFRVQASSHLF